MSLRTFAVTSSFVATAVAAGVAATASADIGFSAAVDGARAAAPLGTLFGIQQRQRNGAMVYEGELYNAALTTRYEPRLNLETGALIRLNINTVSAANRAALQPIADRLDEVQIDFAAAIDAANTASSRSDVQKVAYDIEAGILAYQVEYFDGDTKMYIDSVTGGVIPHHGADDDMDPTNPSTSVIAAIGLAESHKNSGKGASWVTIGLENESEKGGNIVEVLLMDLDSSMLSVVRVAGDAVLSASDFEPAGNQASRVAAIRANWDMVVTGLSAAIGAAEAAYPGAGIAEVEFEVETEKTGTTINWKINLITAEMIEIDYIVDASQAIGNGFRFATAPVTARQGDYNRDGIVDALDITEVFNAWGSVNPIMDVNGDDMVGAQEVTAVISNWG
jgi:hypothetical protein